MKNFSKVLALILVVATLFSFVAMTASAKEFEDSDKISYAEAVDVLSNIGIIDGYTNDTFRPTNNIKRSEMAKMIAVLSNAGKDDMGDLYASACKFADVKDNSNWAKSYIAYCNQKGIVAGRNATTFDPEGKVTGIETAKMLLVVMGFDAETQGYVGTGWKTHVLADADKVGLLDNFAADFEPNSAITREEAAQMMLNALEGPMVVGTVSDNIVKVSNNVWINLVPGFTDNTTNVGIDITLADAARLYDCFVLYGNVVVSPIPVYASFTGLSRDDAMDCYGNPVTVWSMENTYGKEIWSSSYEVAPDFYYTTTADIEGDLDILDANKVGNRVLYVDGQLMTGPLTSFTDLVDLAESYSGKGVETKVFLSTRFIAGANYTVTRVTDVTITVKNTYIGEVDYINKAAGTFTLTDGQTGALLTFKNGAYGFERGDVVLYWLCTEHPDHATNTVTLHDAEIAVPVNVDLTYVYNKTNGSTQDANRDGSWITGSSKKYEYAKNLGNYVDDSSLEGVRLMNTENLHDDNTFDLYLDKFGYIMAWEEIEPTDTIGYMYLVEGTGEYHPSGVTSGGKPIYTAKADSYDFDAKLTTDDNIDYYAWYALKKYESGSWDSTFVSLDHGVLVRYVENNGRKDLNVITNATGGVIDDGIADVAPQGSYLDKNGNLYDAAGKLVFNSDDETQYLIRTWDYTKGEFKYEAKTADELEYTYYSDLANMRKDDKGDAVVANIQYFTKTTANNTVATYVFVNALYAKTDVNAFVLDKVANVSGDVFNDIIGRYQAYDAIIDGEKAVLAVAEGTEFNEHYALYNATLAVIGLTDGDVPVYADLNDVEANYNPAEGEFAGWYYDSGRIFVNARGSAGKLPGLKPTEDFFAVIATENTKGGYDVTVVTDPEKINGYYEIDASGNWTWTMTGGYASGKAWAEYNESSVSISELYLKIDLVD